MPKVQENSVVKALFELGLKIEIMKETLESESQKFVHMKDAFVLAVKCLESYKHAMREELETKKVPIKEIEYGTVYVGRCVELIKRLYVETEAKRIKSEAGAENLVLAVDEIKKTYDQFSELE